MRKSSIKVCLDDGKTLETKEATFHEDLPWDAYVMNTDGSIDTWADGNTELEALKKVLEKSGRNVALRAQALVVILPIPLVTERVT